MNDFPRMLYQAGGTEEIHGGRFSTLIVHDAAELDAALASCWFMTTPEAKAAAEEAAANPVPDDSASPTRVELKQHATNLGLTFAPNIPTDKLASMIDAAMNAQTQAQAQAQG